MSLLVCSPCCQSVRVGAAAAGAGAAAAAAARSGSGLVVRGRLAGGGGAPGAAGGRGRQTDALHLVAHLQHHGALGAAARIRHAGEAQPADTW